MSLAPFPKKIYAVRDEDIDTSHLYCAKDYRDLVNYKTAKRKVGVYQLVTETEIETKVEIKDDQSIL